MGQWKRVYLLHRRNNRHTAGILNPPPVFSQEGGERLMRKKIAPKPSQLKSFGSVKRQNHFSKGFWPPEAKLAVDLGLG